MTPEATIQKQVEAYNARHIVDFVACHDQHVRLFNQGEPTPFCEGIDNLRSRYQEVFENSPNLNTEIVNRIVMGSTVIDHEIVTGRAGADTIEMIAIYEVKNGLIISAHFKRK